MKKSLRQDLESYNQPKYNFNSYTTGNITYGGSCPDPRHNATKWKMLNGGYGAEQQKMAQIKVGKNLRWLNNSYNSKAEESEEEKEIEEIQEKSQTNMTELEKALAKIKALEEANNQKDAEIQKLKQQPTANNDNSFDKDEVEEIVKKLKEDFDQVQKESADKDQIIEKKDITNKVLSDKLEREIEAGNEKNDTIKELREDKKYFKDEAKDLKTDLKEAYTENKDLKEKVKYINDMSKIDKAKIDSLEDQLSKLSIFDNNSGNNENNISESFQVVDTSGNDSGLENADMQ